MEGFKVLALRCRKGETLVFHAEKPCTFAVHFNGVHEPGSQNSNWPLSVVAPEAVRVVRGNLCPEIVEEMLAAIKSREAA